MAKEAIDQVLGDLVGRARQPSQAPEDEDHVQGDRLETPLHRVGDAEVEIKARLPGGGGDPPI